MSFNTRATAWICVVTAAILLGVVAQSLLPSLFTSFKVLSAVGLGQMLFVRYILGVLLTGSIAAAVTAIGLAACLSLLANRRWGRTVGMVYCGVGIVMALWRLHENLLHYEWVFRVGPLPYIMRDLPLAAVVVAAIMRNLPLVATILALILGLILLLTARMNRPTEPQPASRNAGTAALAAGVTAFLGIGYSIFITLMYSVVTHGHMDILVMLRWIVVNVITLLVLASMSVGAYALLRLTPILKDS